MTRQNKSVNNKYKDYTKLRDCWKKVLNNWDTLTKSQKALYYFLMSWEIKDNPASQIVGKLEEKGQRFNGAGKNKKKY